MMLIEKLRATVFDMSMREDSIEILFFVEKNYAYRYQK